jgi:hypothetical protein
MWSFVVKRLEISAVKNQESVFVTDNADILCDVGVSFLILFS